MARSHVVQLLALLVLVGTAHAIQFYVKSRETRCFSEDLPRSEMVIGDFTSQPHGLNELNVRVTSPVQGSMFSKQSCADGKFAFTAPMQGEYQICFENLGMSQKQVKLDLKTGVHAKDYSSVAKKENLKPIEVELRRLEDQVQEVHTDMSYLREREEQMRNTNESTNARVLWFSIVSMLILVALGVFQLFHLRRYFKEKKMF